MNEDGEFLCEDHTPEKIEGQWWVDAVEIQVKCEKCEKPAAYYVLQDKE
jgi:hypothetical protein